MLPLTALRAPTRSDQLATGWVVTAAPLCPKDGLTQAGNTLPPAGHQLWQLY